MNDSQLTVGFGFLIFGLFIVFVVFSDTDREIQNESRKTGFGSVANSLVEMTEKPSNMKLRDHKNGFGSVANSLVEMTEKPSNMKLRDHKTEYLKENEFRTL